MSTNSLALTNQPIHEVISYTENLSKNQVANISFAINKVWAMPEFKAKHFVGNAQVTPYAEIKQYFIELNSREDMVVTLEHDVKKAEIELEIEKDKLSKLTDPLQIKLQQLEVEAAERLLGKKVTNLRGAYEERNLYLDLIEKFNEGPNGKLPDGRLMSEAIKTDKALVEQLEKEHWTLRLAKQTAMDMIAYGRAGVGNMDAVAMLGSEQQEEVMALACDYFVRNEMRTNALLSIANDRFQQGALGGKLAQQLGLNIRTTGENQDVHLIQGSK